MKILLISSAFHPFYKGGGEFSAKKLTEALTSKGHEVVVLSAFRENRTEVIDGVEVVRVKHPNIYWSFDSKQKSKFLRMIWHIIEPWNPRIKRLKNTILEIKPDVIHVRNGEDFSSTIWPLAQKLNIPIIQTLNSYINLCWKGVRFKNSTCRGQCMECRMVTLPKKINSKYLSGVVSVSQFVLDEHVSLGYFKNALKKVIYTTQSSRPINLPCESSSKITIGIIAYFRFEKGLHTALEAFERATKNNGAIQLVVAGEGDEGYMKLCKSLISSDKVKFLGKVSSDSFYKAVDLVVIPSIWNEPYPRVLVEAHSFGIPVVSSDRGGTREGINEGKTGYVYPADDVSYLSEILRGLSVEKILSLSQIIKMQQMKVSEVDAYTQFYSEVIAGQEANSVN